MKVLDKNTVENSELIEQTFNFWFNDNEHIRSPFPSYVQEELKQIAIKKFHIWVENLKPEAKDEVNDEMVGEKFEELIFEAAISLVKTDDERISILYPFLPRLGDEITDSDKKKSVIVDRMIDKQKDHSFLKVNLENMESKEKWTTKFELPL